MHAWNKIWALFYAKCASLHLCKWFGKVHHLTCNRWLPWSTFSLKNKLFLKTVIVMKWWNLLLATKFLYDSSTCENEFFWQSKSFFSRYCCWSLKVHLFFVLIFKYSTLIDIIQGTSRLIWNVNCTFELLSSMQNNMVSNLLSHTSWNCKKMEFKLWLLE